MVIFTLLMIVTEGALDGREQRNGCVVQGWELEHTESTQRPVMRVFHLANFVWHWRKFQKKVPKQFPQLECPVRFTGFRGFRYVRTPRNLRKPDGTNPLVRSGVRVRGPDIWFGHLFGPCPADKVWGVRGGSWHQQKRTYLYPLSS